ncbi:MAG: FkbM family methyltransferase [Burkholderiales bacterium]
MNDTQKLDDLIARIARIEDAIGKISSQIHTLVQAYNQGLQETFFSQSAYLGDHRALTRLRSGQLIFVDTRSVDIGTHLLFGGHWEANYVAAFERLLRPGNVVVDIGANHGVYALIAAARVAPNGHVYAFEASEHFCELIRASISVNGLDRSITLENRGVADRAFETTLVADVQMSGGGHLVSEGVADAPPRSSLGTRSQVIQCVALDDYFGDPAQKIDAIKMDIEGAEGLALKGMARLIDRSPTVKIMMEFVPQLMARYPCDAAFVIDFLKTRNFMCWTINPDASLAPARWESLLEDPSAIRNVIAARQMP